MATSEQPRQELAAFLRSRRERRSPAAAGITVAGRRRTPGLRREEVATLAGVSVTWYTWLEQARRIQVSGQVLTSLARALGLDPVETEHLFLLAGQTHRQDTFAAESSVGDGAALAPQYQLLLNQLDPYPACITNRRFDILAWNRGFTVLSGDVGQYPESDRNTLWLMFTEPALREMYDDWEAEASYAVALFRSQAGERLLQSRFVDLIERLESASPEFHELWRRRDLTPFVPASHVYHHPKLGKIQLDFVKMYAADDDKTLVAYVTPPESELAERLAELVAAG